MQNLAHTFMFLCDSKSLGLLWVLADVKVQEHFKCHRVYKVKNMLTHKREVLCV